MQAEILPCSGLRFEIAAVFYSVSVKSVKRQEKRNNMKNLAAKYHAGQFRKGEECLPYIVHPQAVAERLQSWGESEDSVAAAIAWGHDLLEDTTVSDAEIIAIAGKEVLDGIKLLTCPENADKAAYLKRVSESGNRNALLVKIADRICNTRDFIKLKGWQHAYQYMHKADTLLPALNELAEDKVVRNALDEWKTLDEALRANL